MVLQILHTTFLNKLSHWKLSKSMPAASDFEILTLLKLKQVRYINYHYFTEENILIYEQKVKSSKFFQKNWHLVWQRPAAPGSARQRLAALSTWTQISDLTKYFLVRGNFSNFHIVTVLRHLSQNWHNFQRTYRQCNYYIPHSSIIESHFDEFHNEHYTQIRIVSYPKAQTRSWFPKPKHKWFGH